MTSGVTSSDGCFHGNYENQGWDPFWNKDPDIYCYTYYNTLFRTSTRENHNQGIVANFGTVYVDIKWLNVCVSPRKRGVTVFCKEDRKFEYDKEVTLRSHTGSDGCHLFSISARYEGPFFCKADVKYSRDPQSETLKVDYEETFTIDMDG